MSLVRAARIVFAKELRTEFRARELLTTTIVFVLLVLALLALRLSRPPRNPAALARDCSGWRSYSPDRSCCSRRFFGNRQTTRLPRCASLPSSPLPFCSAKSPLTCSSCFSLNYFSCRFLPSCITCRCSPNLARSLWSLCWAPSESPRLVRSSRLFQRTPECES